MPLSDTDSDAGWLNGKLVRRLRIGFEGQVETTLFPRPWHALQVGFKYTPMYCYRLLAEHHCIHFLEAASFTPVRVITPATVSVTNSLCTGVPDFCA